MRGERYSVWMEYEESSGRYLLKIRGFFFTKTLPYPPNALFRSEALIRFARECSVLESLESGFDNGDRYRIRCPRWAKNKIADAMEEARNQLLSAQKNVVMFKPGQSRKPRPSGWR